MEPATDLGNEYAPALLPMVADGSATFPIQKLDWLAAILWPVIVAPNLIVPVVWGWSITMFDGRIGMFAGIALVLCAGWWLCSWNPVIVYQICVGGVLTALSQFFPILHILLGALAIGITNGLGLHFEHIHEKTTGVTITISSMIASSLGAFLATLIVAAGLLALAWGIGWLIGLLLQADG